MVISHGKGLILGNAMIPQFCELFFSFLKTLACLDGGEVVLEYMIYLIQQGNYEQVKEIMKVSVL